LRRQFATSNSYLFKPVEQQFCSSFFVAYLLYLQDANDEMFSRPLKRNQANNVTAGVPRSIDEKDASGGNGGQAQVRQALC
jgi:hypothetical protein